MASLNQSAYSDIRNRLSSVGLPAMPQVLGKLMELCQSEDLYITDLVDLIAHDVALTTKVLDRANSSFYKRQNKPASLMQSVEILGMDMMKLICISESVYQVFGDFNQISDSVLKDFWKHSVSTAITAKLIAKKLNYSNVEEAYLAGLLHDVGRLALLSLEPKVINFFFKDNDELCEVEQRMFKFTHAEIGAWLIEQWHFDSFISDSVLYHHETAVRLEKTHPLIRIVALAEIMVLHLQDNSPLSPEVITFLSDPVSFNPEDIVDALQKQLMATFKILGIDGDVDIRAGVEQKPTAHDAKITAIAGKKNEKTALSDQLRSYILASEIHALFARQAGNTDPFETVVHLTGLLFGFKDAVIFTTEKSKSHLQGLPIKGNRQHLADFSISINDQSNAITDALLHRKITFIDSEGHRLEVVEQQLQRILGSDYLVCIPFCDQEVQLGVLVGSIDSGQSGIMRKRSDFLYVFASQITETLKKATARIDLPGMRYVTTADELRDKTRRIVHEVNNPLTIIKNYLKILNNKVAKKESIGEELQILTEEIDRISNLIGSLTHSKVEISQSATEIFSVINEMVKLFLDSGFVPASIEIIVHQPDQLLVVDCSSQILKQILMNLIKNSVEAMQAKGRIEINCKDSINLDGRKYVRLLIEDNGPGIDEKMMDKLFSHAQSTKDNLNRGLGLGIVYDLVSKAQGHISCRSDKRGTSFEILIPIAASARNGYIT